MQNFTGSRYYPSASAASSRKGRGKLELTVQPRVIRLDERLADLALVDDERVPLATRTTEDGSRAVEGQVQRVGQGEGRVGQEAYLDLVVSLASSE